MTCSVLVLLQGASRAAAAAAAGGGGDHDDYGYELDFDNYKGHDDDVYQVHDSYGGFMAGGGGMPGDIDLQVCSTNSVCRM